MDLRALDCSESFLQVVKIPFLFPKWPPFPEGPELKLYSFIAPSSITRQLTTTLGVYLLCCQWFSAWLDIYNMSQKNFSRLPRLLLFITALCSKNMFLYIFEVDFSIETYFRMILGSFFPPLAVYECFRARCQPINEWDLCRVHGFKTIIQVKYR